MDVHSFNLLASTVDTDNHAAWKSQHTNSERRHCPVVFTGTVGMFSEVLLSK